MAPANKTLPPVVALRGPPAAQAACCVAPGTWGALLRVEGHGERPLGTELTEQVLFRPLHARWAGHTAASRTLLPAGCTNWRLIHWAAVGDEATQLPVDAVLIAEVRGWAACELLIELMPGVTDRRAALVEVNLLTGHVTIGDLGYILTCRRHTIVAMEDLRRLRWQHCDGEATPPDVAIHVSCLVQDMVPPL